MSNEQTPAPAFTVLSALQLVQQLRAKVAYARGQWAEIARMCDTAILSLSAEQAATASTEILAEHEAAPHLGPFETPADAIAGGVPAEVFDGHGAPDTPVHHEAPTVAEEPAAPSAWPQGQSFDLPK